MSRVYEDLIPDKKLVSVTTVTELLSKPALYGYFAKHGLKKARELGLAAAKTGTESHEYMHAFFAGEAEYTVDSSSEDHYNIIRNFHSFVDKYKPEPLLLEQTVYHTEKEYAGTFDGLFKIKNQTVLLDWKTSSAIYQEYEMQINAYYEALTNMVKRGTITIELGKRSSRCLWLVRLDKKKEINFLKDVIQIKPDKKAFKAFCGLLDVYNWTKSRGKTK